MLLPFWKLALKCFSYIILPHSDINIATGKNFDAFLIQKLASGCKFPSLLSCVIIAIANSVDAFGNPKASFGVQVLVLASFLTLIYIAMVNNF